MTKREDLGKLIYQGKTTEVIDFLQQSVSYVPPNKIEIWSRIENYSATQLYDKFHEVLEILDPKYQFLDISDPKAGLNIDSIRSERTLLIKQSIATLLVESFQTNINEESKKNPDFLRDSVRSYLEGRSPSLLMPSLFNGLWEIVEKIAFKERLNEAQICAAWSVSLCVSPLN